MIFVNIWEQGQPYREALSSWRADSQNAEKLSLLGRRLEKYADKIAGYAKTHREATCGVGTIESTLLLNTLGAVSSILVYAATEKYSGLDEFTKGGLVLSASAVPTLIWYSLHKAKTRSVEVEVAKDSFLVGNKRQHLIFR